MTDDSRGEVRLSWNGELGLVEPMDAMRRAGLFSSRLHLEGAFLTFDVRGGDLPTIRIYDADSTAGWLGDVLGPASEAALIAVIERGVSSDDVDDVTATVEVSADESRTLRALRRLALGFWILRYWPAERPEVQSIDEARLSIELASISWRLDEFFGHRQPAATLLEAHTRRLIDIARDALGGDDSRVRRIIADALAAATDRIALDDPSLPALQDLAAQFRIESGEEAWDAEFDTEVARLTDEFTSVEAGGSVLAGGDDDDDDDAPREIDGRLVNVDSVDWYQVPARQLDWDERTVSWTRSDEGDRMVVSIAVRAAENATQDVPLFARIYSSPVRRGQLPIGVVALSLDGEIFAGDATIRSTDATETLVVDVFSEKHVTQPATGDRRRLGRVDRDAARLFIESRYIGLGTGPEWSQAFLGEPRQDLGW